MAIIHHYTRREDGEFDCQVVTEFDSPAEFALKVIPSGTPFACYRDELEITQDADAMTQGGTFKIVEGSGGIVGAVFAAVALFAVSKMIMPDMPTIKAPNQQAESANNSLTDRSNKPRPYERIYDICGEVQSIPSDMMQGYNSFDASNRERSYGYYYIARGFVDTPESGITDGDTLLSAITGSSACIYDPFTSPNNSAPRQIVGEDIDEPLYITTRSNEIDGITLLAPNELREELTDEAVVSLVGTIGTITDNSPDILFNENLKAGDTSEVKGVIVTYLVESPFGGFVEFDSTLDGLFPVLQVQEKAVTLDVSSNLISWQKIPSGSKKIKGGGDPYVKNTSNDNGFTDWVTVTKIKPERIMCNIVAGQGLYKENNDGRHSTSVSAEIEYQLVQDGQPVGPVMKASQTITDKTGDEIGISIIIPLPTPSNVRVRARRSSDKDFNYGGAVNDEVKFRDLYAQIKDKTPHYGDLTTVHTVRRNTSQATAVREPQLKVIAAEMLFKYLGGGVFDTVRTPNTQAVQSLIRLMQDPMIGGLTLTAANMDKLLAVQAEIESYFGNPQAGQFCYTFDDANLTAQDIANTIASAICCTVGRANAEGDIALTFEKAQQGPAMVFTHRSKLPSGEKWDTQFPSAKKYDSVELTYINPETNIKETIRIPDEGGAKPNKIETKGVRNEYQARILANRARQKDKLRRVNVEFTATEDGLFVQDGQAISVVKGSRVSPADGYIVAQNGLVLTLSQEVTFTDGDSHSIILKRRDGTAQSIDVEQGATARQVVMLSAPSEPIYTGNSALKTEFSFGNEARHLAQMIVPATIDPNSNKSVKITGYNYDPDYYLFDGAQVLGAFDGGFDGGFSN